MGTSQSLQPGVKDNPNWGILSRQLAAAAKRGTIPNENLNNILNGFTKIIGGSEAAGSGRSKVFGRAGISTIQNLFSFYFQTKSIGLAETFRNEGIEIPENASVDEIINILAIYCSEGDSNFDETAAKAANLEVLEELFGRCNSIDDIETKINSLTNEEINEVVIIYFTNYIVEFSSQLFEERILHNQYGNRRRVFLQIKDYIKELLNVEYKVKNLLNINWKSESGREIVKDIQTEILGVFEI